MWKKLISIKQHRETRLRIEISRMGERINELTAATKRIDNERAEVIGQWQALSKEQCFCKEDQFNSLRKELNHYFSEDTRLRKERADRQQEIAGLQQQRDELNRTLLTCVKKQEKLRLLSPLIN